MAANRDVTDYCYQWTGSYCNTDNGSYNILPCNIVVDWWEQTDGKLRSEAKKKKSVRDNTLKWVQRQRSRDRDRGERWGGSNNIIVYSYISVVHCREVWSFCTCLQLTLLSIFSSLAHFYLMQFFISIHLFYPYDIYSSLLIYSYSLCPISLVGFQRSPVPTPPKSSLPHLLPLCSLASPLLVFLIHSPLCC